MDEKHRAKYFLFLFIFLLFAFSGDSLSAQNPAPYKIYVMMGFHTSFYHSWRGDSNDEAGFGTDIRVVRGILQILNEAEKRGQKARGYWDIDGYYTLERIIPENAPDIIEGIRSRVKAGQDEVLPAPYNNGIISAHTPDEMRRALTWTIENPWRSGLNQVFGAYTPIYRFQESMTTTGMIPELKRAGIEAIILPYSALPFTTISAFVPPLEPEERFGTFLLKHETGPETIAVIPCYNQADALDYGSFELWLRALRKLQTSGKVKQDLILHYNMDADAEIWLPMKLPFGLSGLPNTGGLVEIINAVNKYPWAEFTTPGEFLKNHPPKKEVLVRQDTADGSFDGYYSWAEKYQSHEVWTNIEQSRMYSYRADALIKKSAQTHASSSLEKLWADRDSSFWFRLIGMSTTHFGMSTPIINEERQEKAYQISGKARAIAFNALKEIAGTFISESKTGGSLPYVVTVFNYPKSRDGQGVAARAPVFIPVIIQAPAAPRVTDTDGNRIPASLINIRPFSDGTAAAEVTFIVSMGPEEAKTYKIDFETSPITTSSENLMLLNNDYISLKLSEASGVQSFKFGDREIGKSDFLDPFITYKTNKKPVIFGVTKWRLAGLKNESLSGLKRARLIAEAPIKTPDGIYTAKFTYTFSLYDDLPYLVADVEADYPYTPPRDLVHTIQQKLRRLLDLRWLEVGPFQIHPNITAPEKKPITIWKHNYLDVTSSYNLDYGLINPKNRNIDSFNHQITNGWVAMDNGTDGLLIAQDTGINSVFAFTPMRLRVTSDHKQHLGINPFGTYFGRQFDYSHLGSNGTGSQMTIAVGAHLKPSGPSWNGKTERFRIMLAPYAGNQPPGEMRDDAMAFFYPFGVIYNRNPVGPEIVLAEEMQKIIEDKIEEKQLNDTSPLPTPTALLANPADNSIDLVWDYPRDVRIIGFEVRWKQADTAEWNVIKIEPAARFHIAGLANGTKYEFAIRSLSAKNAGDWSPEIVGIPHKVDIVDYKSQSKTIPFGLILKLAKGILKHEFFLQL